MKLAERKISQSVQSIISKDFELSLNIKKYHNMFIGLTA